MEGPKLPSGIRARLLAGMVHTGLADGHRRPRPAKSVSATKPGHARMRVDPVYDANVPLPGPPFDGKLTFDKLTDVYNSGTAHDEDQPCPPRRACSRTSAIRAARRSTAIPARISVPPRSTKWSTSGQPPADQRLQLRPLQDLRHHGPVPDHQLGSTGRWRRSLVRLVVAQSGKVFKVDLSLTYEK